MHRLLFFITAIFSTSFNHAMIHSSTVFKKSQHNNQHLFSTIPKDILNQIVCIDCSNEYSSRDFRAEDFKAYVILKSTIALNKNEKKYNFYFDKNFKEKHNKVNALLLICMPLSSVNKSLNASLADYRELIVRYLSDENILLSGYQLNKSCQFIANDLNCVGTFSNPLFYLINIKRSVNIQKPSAQPVGGDAVSKNVVNDCTLIVDGFINADSHMYRIHGEACPILGCNIFIIAPFTTYNTHHFVEDYFLNPTTQSDSLAQAFQPIFDDFNKTKCTDITEFEHVKNLFDTIVERVLSNDTQNQKKLNAFFTLCKFAYDHCNDYQYNRPKQRVDIHRGGQSLCSVGVKFLFDLGPTAQQTIPLKLINDILRIKTD